MRRPPAQVVFRTPGFSRKGAKQKSGAGALTFFLCVLCGSARTAFRFSRKGAKYAELTHTVSGLATPARDYMKSPLPVLALHLFGALEWTVGHVLFADPGGELLEAASGGSVSWYGASSVERVWESEVPAEKRPNPGGLGHGAWASERENPDYTPTNSCPRRVNGTKSRFSSPMKIWRGRAIFLSGSDISSFHWASHPTVRGIPNRTVN